VPRLNIPAAHFARNFKNNGEANALLAKLNAAANALAAGNCAVANNTYQAFINELNAQSGNGVDAAAAAIMIGDAQYLMAHCPCDSAGAQELRHIALNALRQT
jgi:hypothetical protein